jgi:hypothetical protein
MGRFAETSDVDYGLLFADQGKQTSVFRLQKRNGSLPFLFTVCNKQMKVAVFYIYIYLYIIYIYLHDAISNVKWKTEAQTITLNLFTVCSSCKGKFVVCPFVYEETNGSYPFSNGLKGLADLYLYAAVG